jgi:hypothetical protein
VFGEKEFNLAVTSIHPPPLGDIKVLSQLCSSREQNVKLIPGGDSPVAIPKRDRGGQEPRMGRRQDKRRGEGGFWKREAPMAG